MNRPLLRKPIPLLLIILALLCGGVAARWYRHSHNMLRPTTGAKAGL